MRFTGRVFLPIRNISCQKLTQARFLYNVDGINTSSKAMRLSSEIILYV